MNLDSIVRVRLAYVAEATLADIVDGWTDGEIAELLEGDPEALEEFCEETFEWVLGLDATVQEIEVDDKDIE